MRLKIVAAHLMVCVCVQQSSTSHKHLAHAAAEKTKRLGFLCNPASALCWGMDAGIRGGQIVEESARVSEDQEFDKEKG